MAENSPDPPRSGSSAADLNRLYRENVTMIRSSAWRILGNGQLVDDVVQEAFTQYLSYARDHQVDTPGALLYSIAIRIATKHLREKNRVLFLTEGVQAAAPTTPPDHRILMKKIFAAVNEEEAHVAIMRFIEGLSYEEICEVTGVSKRTIGYRLERFCAKAARLIEPAQKSAGTKDPYALVAAALGSKK